MTTGRRTKRRTARRRAGGGGGAWTVPTRCVERREPSSEEGRRRRQRRPGNRHRRSGADRFLPVGRRRRPVVGVGVFRSDPPTLRQRCRRVRIHPPAAAPRLLHLRPPHQEVVRRPPRPRPPRQGNRRNPSRRRRQHLHPGRRSEVRDDDERRRHDPGGGAGPHGRGVRGVHGQEGSERVQGLEEGYQETSAREVLRHGRLRRRPRALDPPGQAVRSPGDQDGDDARLGRVGRTPSLHRHLPRHQRRRSGQDPGQGRLQRRTARRRRTQEEERPPRRHGHLRAPRRLRASPLPGPRIPSLVARSPTPGRKSHPRQSLRTGPERRRRGRHQGQGLPGRHEAMGIRRNAGVPRHVQESPRPGIHGPMSGSGQSVQGEEDGGEDGEREEDGAEPEGREGGSRTGFAVREGGDPGEQGAVRGDKGRDQEAPVGDGQGGGGTREDFPTAAHL
mmetsp:Transcript_11014/g.23119  ORF Transcript_11014/g.23119 Transcript_11014/m.23119 type:complete len:447 (+) Transcript_11014:422-1762(+)